MPELYNRYAIQETDELVEVLDDQRRAFMVMALDQAYRQRLCYQLALTLLYCPQGSLYIRQHSKQSPLFPECWDVSAFTPVRAKEAPVDAASRSLYDALRVKPTHCVEIASELRTSPHSRHIVTTFVAHAPSQIPAPDSRFIDRLIKVNPSELQIILQDFSAQTSPALRYVGEKGLVFKEFQASSSTSLE